MHCKTVFWSLSPPARLCQTWPRCHTAPLDRGCHLHHMSPSFLSTTTVSRLPQTPRNTCPACSLPFFQAAKTNDTIAIRGTNQTKSMCRKGGHCIPSDRTSTSQGWPLNRSSCVPAGSTPHRTSWLICTWLTPAPEVACACLD